jgi:diguanylate cyclase (GGDEF)-like protein/PAS domain S-box-containing protein
VHLVTKTTLLLTAVVTTVLVTVSVFFLHYHEESLRQTILKGVDGQVKIAAHGIETFISEGLKDAHATAITLPMKALLQGRFQEVESHLKKLLEIFPEYQNGIFILDKDGTFLVDYPSHPELRGQSFAFRQYYQRTVQEKKGIVGEPYISKRTGQPVLTFTSPVTDEHGQLIAIVACSTDLLSYKALGGYRKQKFGDTGYLFIFDRARRLVLHPEDDRLLTFVGEGKNMMMEAAIKGFEGGGETVNSKGVPMLLSVRRIANTDWIVAVQVTQKEAYAPVAKARERILLISGIAILLAIVLGAIAIRRVSRPLEQFERVASQISAELESTEREGTYDPAHSSLDILKNIRSRDEIGLLAASFLHLAAKLNLTLGSLQRSAEEWERTFNSVKEAVVTLDRDGRIIRMNRTAEDWFRKSAKKVQGQYGYRVIFGNDTPPGDWPDISSLSEKQRVVWSHGLERMNGIFEFTITPITHSGTTTNAVLVISDVTERVESEEQIREMAFYDQLTGLPNRFLLKDRIQQAIASASRNGKKAGIMFIDLDRFKEINDLCGHDVGDEVLKEKAKEIALCLRKNDTLSRFGGDEFVAVLQDIDSPREAETIAVRIIEMQAFLLSIDNNELKVSLSIGIALFPDDGADSETLLKHSDIAMYRVKNQGRNNYQFYSQERGGISLMSHPD